MGLSASPWSLLNSAFILLIIEIIFYSQCATAVPVEGQTGSLNTTDIKSVCGRRKWNQPSGRIVGGTETKFADYPWMAALFNKNKTRNVYHYSCGGSLLNNNWVLTAAHCVYNYTASEMFWDFGEHDMSHGNESLAFVEIVPEKIVIHPNYDRATYDHDIALVKFKDITFMEHIIPICLPETNDTFAGETATAIGWGAMVHRGSVQDLLREVQLPVLTNDECTNMYKKSGPAYNIPDTVVCAGKETGGVDACQGDSGGPLMIHDKKDDKFVIIGVNSWGVGCGVANKPGVYERVSQYMYWIRQTMSN